ncbi:metal-binding, possibly nucleic acid-binding protein [Legionella busanensis]|uniref:Large ribosomal RNA subunit accumulation protein YceD n=1 Tax=Legionella busanensis TaxID=190655 RepID=A0A378JKS4_9GAMM|nr:YceD family protein [Legionella busanensis]STX51331.1 metal-binding, possibly nucleic acid-binding protein [Legionella busanensis]
MLIDLKTQAKQLENQTVEVYVTKRLPNRIPTPCSLKCIYEVKPIDNYFLLSMQVSGTIEIECQRCLNMFLYDYKNITTLAICNSEASAEKLMEKYECIVANNFFIDLVELVTDELHLYSPEYHLNIDDCDAEVSKFIRFSSISDDKE